MKGTEDVGGLYESFPPLQILYLERKKRGKEGRVAVPRNESKYPFASFCNRVAAPSMVLYRLSSTS